MTTLREALERMQAHGGRELPTYSQGETQRQSIWLQDLQTYSQGETQDEDQSQDWRSQTPETQTQWADTRDPAETEDEFWYEGWIPEIAEWQGRIPPRPETPLPWIGGRGPQLPSLAHDMRVEIPLVSVFPVFPAPGGDPEVDMPDTPCFKHTHL